MAKKRYLSVILSVIMVLSGICAVEAILPQTAITAYAATAAAPKVTVKCASATSVTIKWKKTKGAKKYVVYRSAKKSSGYKAIKTTTSASFKNTKLTCGKTYYYKVEAVYAKSKKASKPVSIKVTPLKPTGTKAASDTCGQNKISFKKSSGATGYQIYYSTNKSGTYSLLATTKNTSYTHKIGAGKTGYYKVRAYKTVSKKKVYGAYSAVFSGAAMSHSYGSYIIDVNPTCAKEGSKYSVCSVCGAKDVRKIEPTGEHRYVTTVVEPTCISGGYTNYKCSYCGKSFTDKYKAASGHNYNEKIIAPTCTEGGYSLFTCKACNNSYIHKYLPATGHTFNTVMLKQPTCLEEGKMRSDCEVCGYSCETPVQKSVHNYGRTEIVKEPTCNEDGEVKIYCLTDGCDKYIECGLDRTPHTYEYVIDEEEHSYCHCLKCIVCGREKYNSDDAWQECDLIGEIVEQDGEEYSRLYCAVCGTEYIFEPVNSDCPHEDVFTVEAVDATCEDAGHSESVICGDCYTVLTSATVIAPLGHNFETEENAVAPTCTENGKTARERCTRCGEVTGGIVTDDMIARGHDYKLATISPSCTQDGCKVLKCTKCGNEIEESKTEITKATHSFSDSYTISDKGYRIYNCTKCDDFKADTTCYINLDTKDISVPDVASFTTSASGNRKLLLTYDGESDYEITGSAKDLIIDLDVPDVDSTKECDIKLAGVDITNDSLDIINIKNQTADGSKVKVSITAKVDTTNKLTTVTQGNAIDSSCTLSLKGRGNLVINTASTAISCGAKLEIKNLYLDITSANRGIDLEATKPDGVGSDYFNLEISCNAVIKIEAVNDGIRCKNLDAKELADGEYDSTVTINSTDGDGIDAKGDSQNRRSVMLYSGNYTITASKKQVKVDNKKGGKEFNNTPIVAGTATANFPHD